MIARGDATAERPILVALHGGPGLDHLTVKSALGPLAEDFQIVYFDLRGHGRSDHSSAEFWNMRTGQLPAETTRLVRLPGARHTIFRDRPDLAFPAVRNFVSQVRESQPG